MPYKILIVDDEPMLTELLSDHLSDNGYTVFTANSAAEALPQLKKLPDLILLDINMPDMDGLELCKTIREHVSCPIVFLTARITEQDKVTGFLTGGDDYITKPFGLAEITARIAAHLRRDERSRVSQKLVASQELIVDLSGRTVHFKGMEITFSKREFDIMEFLITNAGQVFDRESLYEAVWGLDADGDNSVIKEHIRKIRQKLSDVTGRDDYIETVWGVGYKWKKQ
ncbi:MAG: response regulator transcription factor [Oscillospiraceae bacterium]|nr:response regulator transcription factor [Oscillospiraceae bacterium]